MVVDNIASMREEANHVILIHHSTILLAFYLQARDTSLSENHHNENSKYQST